MNGDDDCEEVGFGAGFCNTGSLHYPHSPKDKARTVARLCPARGRLADGHAWGSNLV